MATRGRVKSKQPKKRKTKKPVKKTAAKKSSAPKVRDYKAEYKRRIEKAIAKGKTRQQARGHKEKEHIERREREKEEHGFSSAQLRSVRSFLSRFNPREYKEIPTEEDLLEYIQENGYEAFQQYRGVWDKARKKYLSELANGSYENRGLPYLNSLTGEAGAPNEQWLYYH